MPKCKKEPSTQGEVDVSEASKGVSRLKDLELTMEFAQSAVKMHGDSRLVQMDRANFTKLLGTKVEIVSTGVVLPSLERLGEELWC